MEFERQRAADYGYEDPMCETIEETERNYKYVRRFYILTRLHRMCKVAQNFIMWFDGTSYRVTRNFSKNRFQKSLKDIFDYEPGKDI